MKTNLITPLFLIPLLAAGAEHAQTGNEDSLLDSIKSGDEKQFEDVYSESYRKKLAFGAKLLAIFKSTASSNFEKAAAVFLIGQYRITSAAPVLAHELSFEYVSEPVLKREKLIYHHPVGEALVELGVRSIQPVLDVIFHASSEYEVDEGLGVICVLSGRDRDVVNIIIDKAAKKFDMIEKGNNFKMIVKKYTEPYGKD